MIATAVPSTVTVAASPRDMFVFAITNRTGYSKTSARKMPTKTIRNVSPIAQKAARTAIAAATRRIVRTGRINSTRRLSPTTASKAYGARRPVQPVRGANGCSSSAPGCTIP